MSDNPGAKFQGFVEDSRTDPTTRTVTANDAGRVILDLGDRASTLIVNEDTDHILLLNKLVEWRSNRVLEEDGSIDKTGTAGGMPLEEGETSFQDPASGFGIHIAAATGDASDNAAAMAAGERVRLDSNGFERGRESNRIDIKDADGNVSDELIALVQFAVAGGDVKAENDNGLRIGEVNLTGPARDHFVEIIVDGRWSSDVIKIEGALATQLAAEVPDLLPDPPEASVAGFIDVKDRDSEITFRDWAEGESVSVFIGGDGNLLDAPDGFAFDVGDFNRNETTGFDNLFTDEDMSLAILAGVIEFNENNPDIFTDLEVDFGEDGLVFNSGGEVTNHTVVIGLTNNRVERPTDFIVLDGSGVTAAIQAALDFADGSTVPGDPDLIDLGIAVPDVLIA